MAFKFTKMIRKLTPSLREGIKKGLIKSANLRGEALLYWRRVDSLKKARAKKKSLRKKAVKIGKVALPINSEIEKIIKASAKAKGMTVSNYVKKNKKAIQELVGSGKVYLSREVDYVTGTDIKKSRFVFVKGKRTGKVKAKYLLTIFKQRFVDEGIVYPIINVEHYYNTKGDIFLDFPLPDEYENLSNSASGDELAEIWRSFIDNNYPNISYIPNG